MAAVSAAESQKSRKAFEVGLDFISRCSKADYLYDQGMEIQTKSYHGYGNGQGDINVVDRHCGMQYLSCCRVYDYPKKSDPTFTQWSKGIGKVVICKALHKGNVN